jgi:hypothetical protein
MRGVLHHPSTRRAGVRPTPLAAPVPQSHHPAMVGYRRNFVPGGTFFFTVTLADRTSNPG